MLAPIRFLQSTGLETLEMKGCFRRASDDALTVSVSAALLLLPFAFLPARVIRESNEQVPTPSIDWSPSSPLVQFSEVPHDNGADNSSVRSSILISVLF
jgi:hypothetical protein